VHVCRGADGEQDDEEEGLEVEEGGLRWLVWRRRMGRGGGTDHGENLEIGERDGREFWEMWSRGYVLFALLVRRAVGGIGKR
jgi:hypothetical protein